MPSLHLNGTLKSVLKKLFIKMFKFEFLLSDVVDRMLFLGRIHSLDIQQGIKHKHSFKLNFPKGV